MCGRGGALRGRRPLRTCRLSEHRETRSPRAVSEGDQTSTRASPARSAVEDVDVATRSQAWHMKRDTDRVRVSHVQRRYPVEHAPVWRPLARCGTRGGSAVPKCAAVQGRSVGSLHQVERQKCVHPNARARLHAHDITYVCCRRSRPIEERSGSCRTSERETDRPGDREPHGSAHYLTLRRRRGRRSPSSGRAASDARAASRSYPSRASTRFATAAPSCLPAATSAGSSVPCSTPASSAAAARAATDVPSTASAAAAKAARVDG